MEWVSSTSRDGVRIRIIILIRQIDNVILLDDRQLLETQLNRMKTLLLDISDQFCYQRTAPLQALLKCFERMENEVKSARLLIQFSQWPQLRFNCLLLKPSLSGQIFEWMTNVDKLYKELEQLTDPQTLSLKMARCF